MFPETRMRRLRNGKIKDMVRETSLSVNDLIYPLFINETIDEKKEVPSMPGVFNWPLSMAADAVKEAVDLGIPAVLLFGIPKEKDPEGHQAYGEHAVVQEATRRIKEAFGKDIIVITDLCMCEYTSHGHCGIIDEKTKDVDNDLTLPLLGKIAVSQAEAGADIIAPSGMMDGMIEAIRTALDDAGFTNIPIMSYSAKYASCYYGPFRDAAESGFSFGDRTGYQMDPANGDEAVRETELDVFEGADMIMVKPGMPYLDILRRLREEFSMPTAVYQVSGEYAMIKAAAQNGWLDEKKAVREAMICFKRAGADMIITYYAKEVARMLREEKRSGKGNRKNRSGKDRKEKEIRGRIMDFEKSKELYERAKGLIPGGVSSPVRAIRPFPFYTASAKGSRLYDADGNELIDYCLAYGPAILGHAHPVLKDAIAGQLDNGWLYGTPSELEVKLAERISGLYPSVEMMRFVSTGTEATMSAIRLARGFTGRDKIIKIEGGFHGAHDAVLVKAGSGATTHGEPNSPGIPADVTKNTLQAPYNDIEVMTDIIEKNRSDLAAVIIEPVMGNIGTVLPKENYLKDLRKVTEENDVLLIFDEVITGCRLSMGGAQKYFGVRPDLTTLGKIVGGGMPVGVFGGRKEIMEMISPQGPVYQAGTFSGHPASMAAGLAMLDFMEKNNVCETLNARGDAFRKALSDIVSDKKKDYFVGGISSMFTIFFGEEPHNYQDVLKCDAAGYMEFFRKMLNRGIFLPPSQFETNFISFAHTEEDFRETEEAVADCL